jgi:hypothetical protein
MKQLLILTAFLILGGAAYAQNYNDFAFEFFTQHQPNARAEAMGRGNGAVPGGSFQTYYNAAASSFTEGANAAYTKVDPAYIMAENWFYYNYGASYNTEKYGALAFNYLRYTYGTYKYNDPYEVGEQSFEPVNEIFSINYSYKLKCGLALGVNANFFQFEMAPNADGNTFFFDLGVLKKFAISEGLYKQNAYAGISYNNLLNQKAETEVSGYNQYEGAYSYTITDYLPSTLRVSGAYEIKYDPEGWALMPASLIASAEYQDMLNSKYYTMIKFGAELTLFEIFKTRCGFYTEGHNDLGNSENTDRLNEFTYGFGLSFPVYKLAPSVPLEINADYVNLKNPVYNKVYEDYYKNYNLFTVSAKVKI